MEDLQTRHLENPKVGWNFEKATARAVAVLRRGAFFSNYLIAFAIILILNFALPRMMPGDPLQAIYGEEALLAMTPQLEAELIARLSLDQSMGQQFASYIIALLSGDLGHSYYYNQQVLAVILDFLPWTLLLTGTALVISTLAGLVLGVESGYKRGRNLDKTLLAGLMFLNGFPDFFMGIVLLLVFGVVLGLVPLSGALTPYSGLEGPHLALDILHHLLAPLAALVLVRITSSYLLTRNTMITTLKENFILTARAKGCSEGQIKYRHAGRNSLLPVVTATGLMIPHLITGALFVEIVFSYPGVGWLLYNALLTRDYPLIQGILLMVTVAVLVVNLLVDILYQKLDPRVSHAR
ncbi:MAG TPA: ABC transporter permease [Methanotrichaceae archaeon]|nr:ABC transporter permease [Methanotrichaceae archaeon]